MAQITAKVPAIFLVISLVTFAINVAASTIDLSTAPATPTACADVTRHAVGNRKIPAHLTLRLADPADRDAILNFVEKVRDEYAVETDRSMAPGTLDHDLQHISTVYSAPLGAMFLLTDRVSGEIVATAGVTVPTPGRADIRKFYLRDSLRGSGLGRLLMNAMLGTAKDFGATRVELRTYKRMDQALRLYRSVGFQAFEPERWYTKADTALFLQIESP